MARTPCRARTKGPSKAAADNNNTMASTTTPHLEADVARGVLIGARVAKRFDVPTPSRPKGKPKTPKKRRGRRPKNVPPPPPPSRPETPPPTIKEIYYGTVTGYNHLDANYDHHEDDVGLYRIHYDDGDTEVLDPDDIYSAFLLHNAEMLRMDIERSRAYPVLASKIAPSWREGTATGHIGGYGLAHQRVLREDELVVLDAERIGFWESYKTYNLTVGVARPSPFSPHGSRRRAGTTTTTTTTTITSLRNQEQQDAAAATGGQTAGELSGSNEVVRPSTTTTRPTTTRRAGRAVTRTAAAASTSASTAAASSSTDNRAVAKSSTPRRKKRRGPPEAAAAAAAAAAPTNSGTTDQGPSKRRKKATDTSSSHGDTTQPEELQAGEGDNTTETGIRVKEEAPTTPNESRGWGLFRRTHINGFGDICDLT